MKKLMLIFFSLINLQVIAQAQGPVRFEKNIHDFAQIREEEGPATHEFKFTNTSDKALTIIRVNASCGCTTPGWSKEPVLPGQTGYVKAQYDPKGRPGYFNKSLTVIFDADEPVILQITGRVVPANTPIANEFPAALGNLRFKSNSINLGKVFINQPAVVREVGIYNTSDKAISIKNIPNQSKYLKAEVLPAIIESKQRAILRITYNAGLKKAYGFQTDNIELVSDDELMPLKHFNVYAVIEEDFSNLSEAELSNAPVLAIDQMSHDFGRLKANTKTEKRFVISNNGNSRLSIRDVQANCSCVLLNMEKKELKKGENTTLTAVFDTEGRKANQPKVITIYSNDPHNPVQRISLNAYVEAQ